MGFLNPKTIKLYWRPKADPIWATWSTRSTWVPFAPTGLPVFLPLCQPGAHLLWLHWWDSPHLPSPQPAVPHQPAQATLPGGGCGPGPGAQVLPGTGRERGAPRVCLPVSTHASWSVCLLAALGWKQDTDPKEAAESRDVCSLMRTCSVTQLCPALCDPMDCSPPGSSVHGILQARILEWVAMSSSKGSSPSRDWTRVSYVSCIGKWVLYH